MVEKNKDKILTGEDLYTHLNQLHEFYKQQPYSYFKSLFGTGTNALSFDVYQTISDNGHRLGFFVKANQKNWIRKLQELIDV